jgi:hypothetical protein
MKLIEEHPVKFVHYTIVGASALYVVDHDASLGEVRGQVLELLAMCAGMHEFCNRGVMCSMELWSCFYTTMFHHF